jgi:hypothetical protein
MNFALRYLLWLVLSFAGTASAQLANNPIPAFGDTVELILPRAAAADEAVWLKLRVGRLSEKSEIVVTTETGDFVGTASSSSAFAARDPGVYLLPLPRNAIVEGRVRVRFAVDQPGLGRRDVVSGEILGVELSLVPIAK